MFCTHGQQQAVTTVVPGCSTRWQHSSVRCTILLQRPPRNLSVWLDYPAEASLPQHVLSPDSNSLHRKITIHYSTLDKDDRIHTERQLASMDGALFPLVTESPTRLPSARYRCWESACTAGTHMSVQRPCTRAFGASQALF